MRSILRCALMRLHLLRISMTPMPGVASMMMSFSDMRPMDSRTSSSSSSVRSPLSSFLLFTLASMAMRRLPRASFAISSEKMTTLLSSFIATFWAMFSASAVLPMDGRAAMMIRSDLCRPFSLLSRSLKCVARPGIAPPCALASLIVSRFVLRTSRRSEYSVVCFVFATSKIVASA